ncbi:GNAT family N-acetyltransferase [Dactylosporangium siamense]|uniref:GNAT family N-acetyltransferase n=1 Tax=Dactylosporangium siamense TaxID=685454 RepID=A0A919UCS8_9ACTN|nr:GNAT family N-acetyltransferase [Dactylosporangium siamense]GIG46930.1 GNAT family N-acetyltransferase [Dactylosporangium siamense]
MNQDLRIVELDVDDPTAVEAAFTIGNEAILADLPDFPPSCRDEHEVRVRLPMPGAERHIFLAWRGDEPVGLVQADLPVYDNLDKSFLDVLVLKQHRRQGVGRALYRHAVDFGLARGRTSVMGFSVITDPDGAPTGSSAPFATATGLENKLTDVRRRLDLSTADDAELDRLLAASWPKAAGYSTVQWGNRPPEELLEDLALLDSSFLDEAPKGDLDFEAEKVDVDRLRRTYETRAHYGARPYETGVIHDASGSLVAWSALRVAKSVDWHAWQLVTLVNPAHRGHRLGMISKVVNLRTMRAQEPAVRIVDTFNAEVNAHMIAINEAMGFRAVDRWANWQASVA